MERQPPSIPYYIQGNSNNQDLDLSLIHRTRLLQNLKLNITGAQNRMTQQANKHQTEKHFDIGEYVLVKLQPYRQHSLVYRSSQKLAKRYFGPYRILEKIGNVAYKFDLPQPSSIHPVFHISLLRAYSGQTPVDNEPIPPSIPSNLIPEIILSVNKETNPPLLQVKWFNFPDEEATWEELSDFCKRFPNFDLEDKVNFRGAGDDTFLKTTITTPRRTSGRVSKAPTHMKDYIT